MKNSRKGARLAIGAAAVCAVAAVAGCAGGGGGTDGAGGQLDIQYFGSVVSLDPALAGQGPSANIISLAYDPLIYLTPDGEYIPDLATEWEYTSDDNTQFEFTLRDGVEFTGGGALDANAVVASMQYFLDAEGGAVSQVGKVADIEAVDDMRVRITYAEPFPDAPWTLAQYVKFGSIIGPDGLSDTDALSAQMDGAGQYVLNREESVTDATYVFDRNPDYWNPDAQMYDRITVRSLADVNAALSAIQTGQVDYSLGDPSTFEAADSAGIDVLQVPFFTWALHIGDREGRVTPALKDRRVRQAIAMSIDRQAIVDAVAPGTAVPNSQVLNEGAVGYVDGLDYGFDPDRARQLLSEAGYPDGFTMKVLSTTALDQNSVRAQAIIRYLEEIGITVDLNADATGISGFTEEAEKGEYSATLFPMNGTTMGLLYPTTTQSVRNTSGVTDAELDSLYRESLEAAPEERTAVFEEMTRREFDLAWHIPVFSANDLHYVGPALTNVEVTAANPIPTTVAPDPQYAWRPADEASSGS